MGKLVECINKDGKLIFTVGENITSNNASELLDAVAAFCEENPHSGVEFDMNEVDYVSSAGLRTLLSVFKREKGKNTGDDFFVLTGVQPQVNETLEITGFKTMFKVKRALRKISLENAKLIGDGFFSKVYKIDNENIVKVYNSNADDENMNRELRLAKYAMLLGVPTAISYDIVNADGDRGVIFEMMNAGSLRDAIRDDYANVDKYIKQYAELIVKLHSIEDTENLLPDSRKRFIDAADKLKAYVSEEDLKKIKALLCTIPECRNIMHGDCHVKNIMLHNGEPVLIDLDTLSVGYPVIELGNMAFTYTAFEMLWPGNNIDFMGLEKEVTDKVFYDTLRLYFAGVSDEDYEKDLDRIRFITWLRMLEFIIDFRSDDKNALAKALDMLFTYLNKSDTLELITGEK